MELNKWCQACQQYKKPNLGKIIVRGRNKRFQCNSCIQRTSQSYLKRKSA